MLRILADENFPGPVITLLRQGGHDVESVKDMMRGSNDRTVLAYAQSESRLLVTCDKDFGELAFRFGLPVKCGIVLFRLSGATPEEDNGRAISVLQSRQDWAGHFTTVTDTRIRMRLLPEPAR